MITTGTHYNSICPYCEKTNYYICDGVHIELHECKIFRKLCESCKKEITYSASWQLEVVAYPKDSFYDKLMKGK